MVTAKRQSTKYKVCNQLKDSLMILMLHKCHTSISIYNFVMSVVMISCEQTYDNNFLAKYPLKRLYTNKYLKN